MNKKIKTEIAIVIIIIFAVVFGGIIWFVSRNKMQNKVIEQPIKKLQNKSRNNAAEIIQNNNQDNYNPYIKKDSRVYLGDQYKKGKLYEIKGADSQTFQYLGVCESVEMSSSYYAKDKNNVYVNTDALKTIDVNSFKYLGIFFSDSGMPTSMSIAKDKRNIYYNCGKINKFADYPSFEILKLGYAKDKNRVYYLNSILRANPTSFRVLESNLESGQTSFAADKENLYYENSIIQGISPQKCESVGLSKCLSSNWESNLKFSSDGEVVEGMH